MKLCEAIKTELDKLKPPCLELMWNCSQKKQFRALIGKNNCVCQN